MTVIKRAVQTVIEAVTQRPGEQEARLQPGEMLWRVCGAPADGCGNGPRRRVYTEKTSCPFCGSEMRVARVQAPPGKVRAKSREQRGGVQ